MPHYWFDLADNGDFSRDLDGVPLASLRHACTAALSTLTEMARDKEPVPDERDLSITVRDGDGPCYRVALTMRSAPLRG